MLQSYTFFDGGTIQFDDARPVSELIRAAFNAFGYYEPAGQDLVTVFQYHHPDTTTGWFTTDTGRLCRDEIVAPSTLCFAYYMPGVFYYAEGGWGHHMPELGNHPEISDAVSLALRFEGYDDRVVVNGNYHARDIADFLKRGGYIPADAKEMQAFGIGTGNICHIPFGSPIMDLPLTQLEDALKERYARSFSDLSRVTLFSLSFH